MGYRFTFNNTTLDQTTINKFYWSIINYEDTINKSIITKNIFNSNIPLTDLLKADVYLASLTELFILYKIKLMQSNIHLKIGYLLY